MFKKRSSMLNTIQRITSSRATRASARALGVATALLALNGCLITSPYWNQEFSDHTKAIPIQTWVGSKSTQVKVECAQAFHAGLYPSEPSANWLFVTNITSQSKGLLDPQGVAVYGAGKSMVLPANCWREDPANNIWYSALRASVVGSSVKFKIFDIAGLECLGRENGKAASWFGYPSKGCTGVAPYVIFRAPS